MKRLLPLIGLMALVACDPSETLTKYGGAAYAWRLVEVDGATVTFANEIAFGPHGSVNGVGPCSRFTARQTAPYPWFELREIDAFSEDRCALSAQELRYFADLQEMRLVEVSGPNMALTNEAGREMMFVGITDGG